jgi:hypothetical protein
MIVSDGAATPQLQRLGAATTRPSAPKCGVNVIAAADVNADDLTLEVTSRGTTTCRNITKPTHDTKMAEPPSTANKRLTQITDFLTMNNTATTIPWDPNSTKFPTRKELPQIPGAPPKLCGFGATTTTYASIVVYLHIILIDTDRTS